FRLFLKAGAKLKIIFVSCKKNLKIFETFFSPHLSNLSFNLSRNFPCFAGCKSKKHFRISQAFLNLFFLEFLPSFDPSACQYFSEHFSLLRVQK
ncbi:hypothetical protein, partial [Flavobacterium panacis]|uniref:hypothetical protein n=1 Tax=Flavobacterium panacis TaxID=2962567 RepID=UPI00214E0EE2